MKWQINNACYYALSILRLGWEGWEGKAGGAEGRRRSKKKKVAIPVRYVCILQSSIYLRSKNKEIAASAPPRAQRNKQSIFAPRDLQRGRAHKSPSMLLSKESAAESCVILRCCRGPPSSSNRCARGHPQPRWHLPLRETKDGNYFPIVSSFPLLFSSHSNLFTGTLWLSWLGLQTTRLATGFSSGIGLYFFLPLCLNLRWVVFSFSSFRIDYKSLVNSSWSVMTETK